MKSLNINFHPFFITTFPDLEPYTAYKYAITACTAAGCTTSKAVGATTLQAAPQGKLSSRLL